jgi:hypothetical protein
MKPIVDFAPHARFTAHGMRCVLRRYRDWWCGYVWLPASHPWTSEGVEAHDLSINLEDVYDAGLPAGGATYIEQQKDGSWWVGFDTCHAYYDTQPTWINATRILREFAALVGRYA